MHSSHRLAWITAAALAFLFAVTIVVTVLLRAETTYNYPAYSSLNNSADGTKAYFEALNKLGFIVTRNYRPLRKLQGEHTDIFYAGTPLADLQYGDDKDLEDFEQLAKSGARLIIAAQPQSVEINLPEKKSKETFPDKKDVLKQHWGIEVGARESHVSQVESGAAHRLGMKPLTGYFAKWSKDWSPSLTRSDGHPLLLERRFGKGSVLLISDCRYFTNRELLTRPDTQVLAAVPGAPSQIIFDENHLGLEDTGTVVGLTTAHRLNWIFAGFIVLAVLYIWRSSVSFIPPVPMVNDSSVTGQNAYAALTNLLMQSVRPKSLLHKAAQEWNSSAHLHRNRHMISAEELALLPDLDPASTLAEYKSLSERLNSNVLSITVK